MNARLLLVSLLLPAAAIAAEADDGERIFDANCAQCHTFHMARGMLMPKPAELRPAYLAKFLKTHPPKLTESEKQAVIAALSRPDR